jgi:hypothetical protein
LTIEDTARLPLSPFYCEPYCHLPLTSHPSVKSLLPCYFLINSYSFNHAAFRISIRPHICAAFYPTKLSTLFLTLKMINKYPLYTSAILVPILSCIAVILDVPPMIWHMRNHNIGASALIFWLVTLNLINFCNALIWPRDNISEWWNGGIFCDIQVRLIMGATIGGLPGATLCIMKALARVLDSKRTIVSCGVEDRRRQCFLDSLLCFGLPAFVMVVMYIVQGGRYFIFGISGCDIPIDRSWPSAVILFIWPPIILLISSYYSGVFRYDSFHDPMETD